MTKFTQSQDVIQTFLNLSINKLIVDITTDVVIHCEDGIISTQKIVRASISNFLYKILKEHNDDSEVSILAPNSDTSYFKSMIHNYLSNEPENEVDETFSISSSSTEHGIKNDSDPTELPEASEDEVDDTFSDSSEI